MFLGSNAVRLACLIAAAAVLATSCGRSEQTKPKVAPNDVATPASASGVQQVVRSGDGEATRYSADGKRTPLWSVRWKEAEIDLGTKGFFGGRMEQVSGTLYDSGKQTSTYRANRATADRNSDLLVLQGEVELQSPERGMVLACERLEYRPERKMLRATGNVRIQVNGGLLTAGQELLATPDLKTVSTPELFSP
jgi:hypothetical protein